MYRAGDIGQNRVTLFDRPKPTTGCSANGRRSVTKLLKHIKVTAFGRHR